MLEETKNILILKDELNMDSSNKIYDFILE